MYAIALKEVNHMSKKSIMSEGLKQEIAKELGVYDTVKNNGWGSVSSRNCGNIVRKAIEIANKNFQ
jgi:small acid-soluble spore protein F (minor alpha/beta-type SASP)